MGRNLTLGVVFALRCQCQMVRQEPTSQINVRAKQISFISWNFFFFLIANQAKRNSSESGSSERENYNGSEVL